MAEDFVCHQGLLGNHRFIRDSECVFFVLRCSEVHSVVISTYALEKAMLAIVTSASAVVTKSGSGE